MQCAVLMAVTVVRLSTIAMATAVALYLHSRYKACHDFGGNLTLLLVLKSLCKYLNFGFFWKWSRTLKDLELGILGDAFIFEMSYY